jgi:hypothetical protein
VWLDFIVENAHFFLPSFKIYLLHTLKKVQEICPEVDNFKVEVARTHINSSCRI